MLIMEGLGCLKTKKTFIKVTPDDVSVYTPAGHDDTYNQRLVGPEMGSKYIEVILGEMGPKGTADPHGHDKLEQIIYLLEGDLIISEGVEEISKAGELCFFPVGFSHQVICETGKAKFLIIYAPPKEKL